MTLVDLHESYEELCFGKDEPTELRLGTAEYAQFFKLATENYRENGYTGRIIPDNFMNAKVVHDPSIQGYRFVSPVSRETGSKLQ